MRAYQHPTTRNFGDVLPLPILEHVTGKRPRRADRSETGKVVSVGSVLPVMRPGDWVWGTGTQTDRRYSARETTFLAVRGPLTRAAIDGAHVPEIYGDPALLLPDMYTPDVTRRHSVGILAHYMDHSAAAAKHPDALNIWMKGPWRTIIRKALSCERIIATSLHGIVIADAYNIPVTWHGSYSGKIASTSMKFQDYFLGTRGVTVRPGPVPRLPRDEYRMLCARLYAAAKRLPA
jgi:pyruvyltransferase